MRKKKRRRSFEKKTKGVGKKNLLGKKEIGGTASENVLSAMQEERAGSWKPWWKDTYEQKAS